MSKTIAESAQAYRKRRAEKLARYEDALRDIESSPITCGYSKKKASLALSKNISGAA